MVIGEFRRSVANRDRRGIHPRSKGVKTNGRMFGSTIERAKSGNGERDLAVVAVDR